MKTKQIKKLLCLLLCLCIATGAIAQSDTPSVLERVQNERDSELAELIRAALENNVKLSISDRAKPLELIRKVTVSYTQIKLFDHQIVEITRKIEAKAGPAELRNELMLAKTELEAKRMTELANLREMMGIIPRHAFEKQPIEDLNTWLVLNLIGERVYVLDSLKSFQEYWAARRHKSAGLLSERETLDYIRERLKSRNKLPIRIDIYHKSEMSSAAKELQRKIVSLAIETDSQMETEVNTELSEYVGSGKAPFFIRDGKIRALYPAAMKRPDGGPNPLVTGLVNPNDLEQHILWRLTMPKNVPLTFRIEYDEPSALPAKQVSEMCKSVAKRLGIAEVVEVEEVLVQPIPESIFLGRWLAITDGEVREIEFQAQGQSQLTTMKSGAKKVIPAPWTLTTKEIFIDASRGVTYKGYINAEGNLFFDKGQIFPQGSWHDSGQPEMVFKKVE
ncbi:MAG: hypothetical protein JW837_13425 [Sedimentisphaerales bacterium]|nr:hypothetical protein [Sedimentisphaerales bacterium]